MRYYIWKVLLLGILLFGGLFSNEIFLKSVEWASRAFLQKKFGSLLSFESLDWQEGALQLSHGKLEGRLEGSFERASWKPAFSFPKRELGGHIVIEGLQLVQKELKPICLGRKRWKLFHFNFDLAVPAARLRLADVDLLLNIVREQRQLTLSSDLAGHNLSDLYKIVGSIWQLPEPFADWDVIGGELKGELLVSFVKGQIYNLEGKIDATQIKAENSVLSLCGEWEKLHVDFDLDMSSSLKVDTWDGTFSLIGGRLALLPSEVNFWDNIWDFSQLHSMVSVKNGKVESSFLRGTFFGMKGEIDLDWHSRETLMTLAFQCNSAEMLPFVPERLRSGFARGFPSDHFALDAKIKRCKEGLKLEGNLKVAEKYQLNFGCNFGSQTANLSNHLSLRPIGTFADKLKEQFCLSSKRIGWFRAEGFPLEKFFSPFVLPEEEVKLKGVANFEGTFDERYVVIFYEGERFHLEAAPFDLKISRISEEISGNSVAVHYIDLKTGDHEGLLPIHGAQYTLKREEVVFEPFSALAHIQNNRINLTEIETLQKSLKLRGEAEITINRFAHSPIKAREFSHGLGIDMLLNLSNCEGALEDAIELCEHFYKLPLTQNLRGYFTTNNEGFHFHSKNGSVADLTFSAHCRANTEFLGVNLEKATFQFNYDRKKRLATFSEGKLEATYNRKEYPLQFETFSFSPSHWHLKMAGFEGSVVDGIVHTTGMIESSGLWEKERFVLHNFRFKDWQGKLDVDGTRLNHFILKNKSNRLRLSGEFDANLFKIENIAFDLAAFFPESSNCWNPKGIFEGRGKLVYDGDLHGEVVTSFENLEFGGIHFGDGENLRCKLSLKEGISIQGLEAQVGESRYKLGAFHYLPGEGKLHFDGIDFSIPGKAVEDMVGVASELFRGKIEEKLESHLLNLKDNEQLAGRMNIELFPESVWITLSLNDGCYTLFGQKLDLRSFTLSYDPLELNMKTEAKLSDRYYWLKFDAPSPILNQGRLAVFEKEGGEELFIRWNPDWQVAEVGGSLEGCRAELTASPDTDSIDFEGSLSFESERLVPLLSGKLREMLESISIKGGYKLEGHWHFRKFDPFNPDFYGRIEGNNFGVFSVACNNFSSDLEYCNEMLIMHDFQVTDWSGTLKAQELNLFREKEGWKIEIERVNIENFRLSRLASPWTDMEKRDRPLFRSFCIPELTLVGLKGTIGDLKSFSGHGSLYFTNYAKKTLFSNILQIPTEITARLGLDLTNLIPVRGQLFYTIEDEKLYLNELKDVYSEGKRARFFLAGEKAAYIDFAGNLDVKIRMKQYSLLMKLAELFTLSVRGTVFNPLYTITMAESVENLHVD